MGSTPCTSVGKHEDQAVHHWLPVCLGGLQPGKTQLSMLGLPPNPGLHMCGTRLAKVLWGLKSFCFYFGHYPLSSSTW